MELNMDRSRRVRRAGLVAATALRAVVVLVRAARRGPRVLVATVVAATLARTASARHRATPTRLATSIRRPGPVDVDRRMAIVGVSP